MPTWADATWTNLWAPAPASYTETWDTLDWTNLYGIIPEPPPYAATIRPLALAGATITPTRAGGSVRPLATTTARTTARANRPTARIASPVTVTPSTTLIAAAATTSQLVTITAATSVVGGFELELAPAATIPTTGIPVYYGPTAPTAAGPWLWIDSGTYDFILETG